ncbi:uncharacterized protein LOC105664958 [Ceratitis capitata]|uniref:Uncharacterized protein n=1 Tax=Ceratitis capitata TaxID=7213 RepID=W8C791_CERCA|nr:uncharacterized protein LOC105664958 [Ceratitis capitata]
MSICKLEKISTSSQSEEKERDETVAVSAVTVSDAFKSPQRNTSRSSLGSSATQFKVSKNHLAIPESKVLNVCSLCGEHVEDSLLANKDGSLSSTVSEASGKNIKQPKDSTTNLSQRSHHLVNHRPTDTRPPFLYEQYPLKPALLYDSPLSYVRDPLNRLDQIDYFPQTSLHSLISLLPICHCTSANLPYANASDNSQHFKYARLHSGEEEDRRGEAVFIADAAWETRKAYAPVDKSVESVCTACRHPAFIAPREPQYSHPLETHSTKTAMIPQERNKLDLHRQENVELSLFYNKDYRHKQPIAEEIPPIQVRSNDNTPSLNSHDLDFHDSVPIFEVLSRNDVENYSNGLALKHKDSFLLYEKLRQKRKHSKLVVGEEQPLNKSSDEVIVFGSAKGLNYKLQCWEESRIDWLSELERRHEVRKRRQKRMEYRKRKQRASEGYTRQCSCICQRIRSWLAKWYT